MDEAVAAAAPEAAAVPTIDTNPPPVGASEIENRTPVQREQAIDATLNETWDRIQRNGVDRAPDGKFTNGKAAEAPADTNSVVQPQEVKPETPVAPAVEAPNSWTAEARAHWAKLPPEAQTYIAQRESEAHKAITSYGERLKSFEPLDQLIAQHKDSFARRGLQPAQAFATLLNAQAQLDANPIDGLVNIGLSYGIDLRPLLTGQQGQLPAADPRVGQVTQKLSEIEQTIQRQQQALEQQQQAEAEATLKEFAKDKPYFEDVRRLMSSLLKGEPSLSLSDAYDMAVNADPKVRARIQADQRAAEEKKQAELKAKAEEEAKKKAADAAKAAKVNVRSSSAHPKPRSIDDTLEEAWQRAMAR